MHRIPKLAIAALVVGALLACASTKRPLPPPAEAPLDRSEYVIGLGDQLQITVWRNQDLSGIRLVRTDGMISVPLVDDIRAEGLTPHQLKDAITEKLDEYISAPDVTVSVAQANSKQVYILGEVAVSGPVPVLQDLRVTDAISVARGFGPFADRSDIRIVRREGHDEVEYRFDYNAYIRGRAPGTNILLQPGDTVIIPD